MVSSRADRSLWSYLLPLTLILCPYTIRSILPSPSILSAPPHLMNLSPQTSCYSANSRSFTPWGHCICCFLYQKASSSTSRSQFTYLGLWAVLAKWLSWLDYMWGPHHPDSALSSFLHLSWTLMTLSPCSGCISHLPKPKESLRTTRACLLWTLLCHQCWTQEKQPPKFAEWMLQGILW